MEIWILFMKDGFIYGNMNFIYERWVCLWKYGFIYVSEILF